MFCFCVGGKGKRGFLDATFFRGHEEGTEPTVEVTRTYVDH